MCQAVESWVPSSRWPGMARPKARKKALGHSYARWPCTEHTEQRNELCACGELPPMMARDVGMAWGSCSCARGGGERRGRAGER